MPLDSTVIGELALALHRTKTTDLNWALPGSVALEAAPADGRYTVVAGEVRFKSLEHRNRCVAEHVWREIRAEDPPNTDLLFERARELWGYEIGHADQASGRLLALASSNVDVFAEAAARIERGAPVFQTLHPVEAAVPYLASFNVDSLIALCVAMHPRTQGNLAGDAMLAEVQMMLTRFADEADLLHRRLVDEVQEPTAALLGTVILALSKINFDDAVSRALADARSSSLMRSRVGVWSLGKLLLQEHRTPEGQLALEAGLNALIDHADDDIRRQAVRAAADAMHLTRGFDEPLKARARQEDPQLLGAVATYCRRWSAWWRRTHGRS